MGVSMSVFFISVGIWSDLTAALLIHLIEVFHAEFEAACQILVEYYGVYGELLGSAVEEYLSLEE